MGARAERRSFWTWGYASDEPTDAERATAAQQVAKRLGRAVTPLAIPRIEDIALPPGRVSIPSKLAGFVSAADAERVTHTYGGHSLELLAAARGVFHNPPDAVAHPRTEDELEAALAWCDQQGFAAMPYGGGTSVVWGVNAPEGARGAVTIDLDELNAACSKSTRCPAPGAFRPVSWGQTWKPRCGHAGSRCDTFRRASLGPPSAVGWPPVPAATTPPTTPTLTTLWRPPGCCRRPAGWKPAACPAAAPGQAQTAS